MNAMNDFDKISSPIEARISTGFAKINTAMRSKAWGHAAANGLTPTQTEILSLLATRSVPLRLSAIAQQLVITPATASDAVAALVAKGLIEKGPAIDDKRALSITLTEAGSSMAASANLSLFLGSATQLLSENEKVILLRLIIKMIRQLQDQGDIAVNRMCVTCRYFGKNQEHSVSKPHYCHLVDAPFGDQHLRLDCPEHEEAQLSDQIEAWQQFTRP